RALFALGHPAQPTRPRPAIARRRRAHVALARLGTSPGRASVRPSLVLEDTRVRPRRIRPFTLELADHRAAPSALGHPSRTCGAALAAPRRGRTSDRSIEPSLRAANAAPAAPRLAIHPDL